MKIKKRFLIPILFLGLIASGPRADFAPVKSSIEPIDLEIEELESFIAHQEAKVQKLKPENGSRIIWADSVRKTEYAVVYLHGFSASPVEGAPFHQKFAERYGCNLYLPRLAGHGIDDKESFLELTPEQLMQSARAAIAIGQSLGEKVILISCSTGSTLGTYLAAHNPEAVFAHLMYSPNLKLGSRASKLLTAPWGLQLARLITGGDYRSIELPESCHPYWTVTYRIEGLVCLQDLLEQTMGPATYSKVSQPTFIGYYYKNEKEQDFVISSEEIQTFSKTCKVPEDKKRIVPFPNVNSHVIISDLQSEDLESIYRESYRFAEEVLGMAVLQ